MRAIMIALILTVLAPVAVAKPPLSQVPEIDGALFSVGLADEIRKNCPTISARMVKAVRFINGLRSKALSMGYSEAEIKAYRTSESEKARMRAQGESWLASRGVKTSDDFCRVGREEISKGSLIGSLLRE
jgi:hypothetical protein